MMRLSGVICAVDLKILMELVGAAAVITVLVIDMEELVTIITINIILHVAKMAVVKMDAVEIVVAKMSMGAVNKEVVVI